jgi:hypothetical protein
MRILEKDIEDVLFAHPEYMPVAAITGRSNFTFKGWIARQYSVPSGRIDLLGLLMWDMTSPDLAPAIRNPYGPTYHPLIVELKRGKIDAAAVAQVGRYLHDIKTVIEEVNFTYGVAPVERAMFPVIVGQSVDHQTLQSAAGFGVTLLGYDLEPFTIGLPFAPSTEQSERARHMVAQLIADVPFAAWRYEATKDRLSMGWPVGGRQ